MILSMKKVLGKFTEKAHNFGKVVIGTISGCILVNLASKYIPQLIESLSNLPLQTLALVLLGAGLIITGLLLATSIYETFQEKLNTATNEREKLKQEILKEIRTELESNSKSQTQRDDKIKELYSSLAKAEVVSAVKNVNRISEIISTEKSEQKVNFQSRKEQHARHK